MMEQGKTAISYRLHEGELLVPNDAQDQSLTIFGLTEGGGPGQPPEFSFWPAAVAMFSAGTAAGLGGGALGAGANLLQVGLRLGAQVYVGTKDGGLASDLATLTGQTAAPFAGGSLYKGIAEAPLPGMEAPAAPVPAAPEAAEATVAPLPEAEPADALAAPEPSPGTAAPTVNSVPASPNYACGPDTGHSAACCT